MASGRVPFDADNFMGILTQHMYQAPVPIRALVPPPDVPAGLEAIILKALSKKPEQRYQTMEELDRDLTKLQSGGIPDAVPEMMSRSGSFNVPADFFKDRGMPAPVPGTPVAVKTAPRWGVIAGVLSVVVLLGLVVAVFFWPKPGDGKPVAGTTAAVPPPGLAPSEVSASAPAPPPPPPAPEVKEVKILSIPPGARIDQGGVDRGATAKKVEKTASIKVDAGKTTNITLTLDGYEDLQTEVDGSKPVVTFNLAKKPKPRATSAKPATARPATASQPSDMGGGEIVNPWAK